MPSWFDENAPQAAGAVNPAVPGYASGAAVAPWTRQFTAPTAEQALATPGLQFAINQQLKGSERSAAAQGTLLTMGHQQDLATLANNLALQGYGDAYSRALGEYGLDRENFYNNQDRPFNKFMSLSNMGLNAAQTSANNGSSYADAMSRLYGDRGDSEAAGTVGSANSWSGALSNIGTDILAAELRRRGQG